MRIIACPHCGSLYSYDVLDRRDANGTKDERTWPSGERYMWLCKCCNSVNEITKIYRIEEL